MAMVGLNDAPTTLIKDIGMGKQQLVEIAKALSLDCKLLILDEPTSSLSLADTEKLFNIVRGLKERGISILYISHRMSEIFELCDTLTVMRDGQRIDTVDVKDITPDAVVITSPDFTHCDNTGNISVKTTAATSKTDYNVAGWAGQYTGDSGDARQPRPYYLTNSGTVTVDLFDATMSTTLRVAGLIAYSHAAIRNSTTYKSAKVTLKGKIHQTVKAATFTDDSSETQVTIGGLGGYLASTGSYDCTVENDVEVDATWTGTAAC